MPTKNRKIQKFMDEIEKLNPLDESLEEKLNLIAQKVREEQQKDRAKLGVKLDDSNMIDPSDSFACEGCQ